ncbi:plasmid mobilization relaxosome protein MobC [Propionivibrio sp.]|uniref:plasmid mobilization relaxosome protein MobC n=1 Tax=Propionivibrio sp. TaxID=2212460 RepID=UPI0039E47C0E
MSDTVVIVTRASRDAGEAFTAYCRRRRSTVAEQLRRLIGEALEEDIQHDVEIAPRTIGRGALRFELRLRPNEGRLAGQLAEADGITIQQWFIARLLDAGLKRDDCFVNTPEARRLAEEIERIMRSLLGMANNLNQVARVLNNTRTSSQKIAPERLMVLSMIEKDLMAFVHRAHAVLEKLDNPRGLKPLPKKNSIPITRELCEQIRGKLDVFIRERGADRP